MQNNFRKTENGLTLIEIALTLMVVGFLTIAFLQIYQIQEAKKIEAEQEYKIFTIKDALNKYRTENKHYPCPGRRDKSTASAEFADVLDCGNDEGVGENACHGNDKFCRSTPAGKDTVRIGTVPYKEIGIGREDAIDAYGNQFTYAVTEAQTDEATYFDISVLEIDNPPVGDPDHNALLKVDQDKAAPLAAIEIKTIECDEDIRKETNACVSTGDDATFSDVLFLSHGKAGAGSFTSYGNENPRGCNSDPTKPDWVGTGDDENCDNDFVFVTNEFAIHGPGQTGLPDDNLTFTMMDWTYIWDDASNDDFEDSILNRASGNMGVGILPNEISEEKLHIKGGNLRVEAEENSKLNEAGKVQATQYCTDNALSCFDAAAFGSPTAPGVEASSWSEAEPRIRCAEGFYLAGIVGGAPHCVSVLTNLTHDCGNDGSGSPLFVTGVTVNPDTGAVNVTCASPF